MIVLPKAWIGKDRNVPIVTGMRCPPNAVMRIGTTRFRPGSTWHLAFSPEGKTLASTGTDGFIRLWEVQTGKELAVFSHPSPFCVAFSPDGTLLASGGWNGDLRIWDLATRKMIRRLAGHKEKVYSLTFSPDGRSLASAGVDKTARVWEVPSGIEFLRLETHQKDVTSVAFSSDGKSLATGCDDKTVRLWELATGRQVRQFVGHSGQALSLAFSSDGKTLAAAGAGTGPTGLGQVSVWEVATGKLLHKEEQTTHWHTVVLSPDGKRFAVARSALHGFEYCVAESGHVIDLIPMPLCLVSEMAFSADGKFLATSGPGLAIQVWDLATLKPIHQLGGHQQTIETMVYAGKGRFLVTAGRDGAILWEAATGKLIRRLGDPPKYAPFLATSPDGKLVAVGSEGSSLYEAATGRLLGGFPEKVRHHYWLAFSPESRLVIGGNLSSPANFSTWEVVGGKRDLRFSYQSSFVYPFPMSALSTVIAFTPNGGTVVIAEPDPRNLQIVWGRWNMATGEELQRYHNPKLTGDKVILSPDGRWLATTASDDVIHVLQIDTGKEVQRFTGLKKNPGLRFFARLSFSPDGKTIASGNTDETIRLWEVATGQERYCFSGHRGDVSCLAFSPDGRRLASGSDDTSALVWDLAGVARGKVPAGGPNLPKVLQNLWTDLAQPDATQAYRAIWALTLAPEQSLPFLKERLRPAELADPQLIIRLIADLDREAFAEREKAAQQLLDLGDQTVPDLKKALTGKPSLEMRKRIEGLLKRLEQPAGEQLRHLRALEVLEQIGTPEAQEVLKALTQGIPEARLTQEAKAAWERLTKGPMATP